MNNLNDLYADRALAFIHRHQAATYYLEQKQGMPSMETDAYLLKEVVRQCGSLTIDQVHNGTLKPFILAKCAPLIRMLPLTEQRPPRPISWCEQDKLLSVLPPHLSDMALFVLNTGLRNAVVCNLRWQ